MKPIYRRILAVLLCVLLMGASAPVGVHAACKHDYVQFWLIEPTCTEGGYTVYRCTICGNKINDDEVPALGHDYAEDWEYFDEDYHEKPCSRCDASLREAHTWVLNESLSYETTEDYPGREVYDCNICHEQKIVEIPQLDHTCYYMPDKIVRPTCTQGGYILYLCYTCGNSYIGDKEPALGHDFGEWTQTTAPTCEDPGEEEHTCSRCKETETRPIDAFGHDYAGVVTEPTCTKAGFTTYTCTRCGKVFTADETDALGHDYNAVVTAPTCTAGGFTTHTCSRCGDTYTDNEKDLLGHDFGEWIQTIAPKCTQKGENTRYCSRCDATETQPVDALGHDYNAVVTAPTCTAGGFTTHTCSRCGDTYTDSEKEALGHEFGDWKETTAPTCTQKGEDTRYCSRCDATETQPVDELGHAYNVVVTDPTCTEDGYTTYTCSRCGDTYTDDEKDLLGHDFGEWKETTAPTCTQKGEDTRYCSRCDATETQPVDALGHDYKKVVTDPTCTAGGVTTFTCSRCGESYSVNPTKPLGHAYDAVVTAPTCTEEGFTTYTCSRCQDTYTDDVVSARGHDWDEGKVTTEPTCTETGVRTFTCKHDETHTYTETVDALGHAYVAVVTAPTCTEGGFTTYTCSRCRDTYTDDVVSALGHDWDDGKITTEPTCTETGVRTFTCKHDETHTYTETVDALGHAYDAVVTAPTCTEDGFTTYTCSRCGDSYIADETPAAGHRFGAWKQTIKPTEYTEGEEKRVCIFCDHAESRTLEKLPATVLTVDPAELSLIYKETAVLTASEDVTWTTSSDCVRVDLMSGKVTTLKSGTATVTAHSVQGGKTAVCRVTVRYAWWQMLIRIFLFGWIWY